MENILQVESEDFYCRFAQASSVDGEPIGWVLFARRGGQSSIEFFTPTKDGEVAIPLSWEPT